MPSASLFERMTSSVLLSMVGIVSTAILALLLIYTFAGRLLFSSSKSKTTSTKQNSIKEKKPKESNIKKQQVEPTPINDKKKKNKAKKNVVVVPSSTPSSQSEESEDEKATPVTPVKKSTPPIGKKAAVSSENKKTVALENGVKTTSGKQQAPVRTENVEGSPGDNKKKQPKTSGTSASVNTTAAYNKQSTTGKGDATTKVTVSTKKQPIAVNAEVKRTSVADGEAGSDQEDEGQWVTQGNKQVNNRHRNKGKSETLTNTNETSPSALSNRHAVSNKRTVPVPSNSNTSALTNKNEFDIEPILPIQNQEPIEICQLLPTNENRYTANDNWWKQPLNKQQPFSVTDIGEWPEREEDEQYVQVKHIIPVRNTNEDEQFNFNEQTNSSSITTAESTATTSQSKKKGTNVRRLS